MLTTRTFDTGELPLAYVEGPDAGPPLLLLHGVTGRWQAHEPIVRALGEQWHVYACDLRGHGESGRAPEPGSYYLRDYARDITAFVRAGIPGDEQVALIGFSLGAMVALGTAAALPDRVQGLVLVEPALMLRNHRFQELPIAELLAFAYQVTRGRPAFEDLVAAARSVMPDADDGAVQAVATQLSKIDPEVTNPNVLDRGLEGVDLGTMLESLRCPILMFHGEPALGSLVAGDDIPWARRHASVLEIVPVAGAGHDIPADIVVERSQRFLAAL